MWRGCLGQVLTAMHRVDVATPAIRTINSLQYSAGPNVRDFKRSKIESILTINVLESAQTESATAVVFETKKDETLRFLED